MDDWNQSNGKRRLLLEESFHERACPSMTQKLDSANSIRGHGCHAATPIMPFASAIRGKEILQHLCTGRGCHQCLFAAPSGSPPCLDPCSALHGHQSQPRIRECKSHIDWHDALQIALHIRELCQWQTRGALSIGDGAALGHELPKPTPALDWAEALGLVAQEFCCLNAGPVQGPNRGQACIDSCSLNLSCCSHGTVETRSLMISDRNLGNACLPGCV